MQHPSTAKRQLPRIAARMKMRCFIVLAMMLAVMVTSFYVNHTAIEKFQDAADTIDVAGRQRMLIQKTGLLIERMVGTSDRSQRSKFQAELLETYKAIDRVHKGFEQRLVDGQVPSRVHEVFVAKPHSLSNRMTEFLNLVKQVAEGTNEVTLDDPSVLAVRLMVETGDLPRAQESVAEAYKATVNETYRASQRGNVVGFVFGLVLLAMSIPTAILPMIKHVHEETRSLENAVSLLGEQKAELTSTMEKLHLEREDRRGRTRAMASVMDDLNLERASLRKENEARQRIQERLEASEHRFYSIIESAPTAMIMVNADGEIILINAEAERLFGYRKDELLGEMIELLVPISVERRHPGHRKEFSSCPYARRMGGGRDLKGIRKDGTEVFVEIGLNPIETEEGLCVLSAIVDITDRKEAESCIQQVNAELKRKNDEMQQFVYTVSHDLKSPLVTCKGFVGMMREDLADERWDDMLDSVSRVERATDRMTQLIEDLLQLSRVGVVRDEPTELEVEQVVDGLVTDLSVRIEAMNANIAVENNIPRIYADPIRFSELLENLISNALKYGCDNENPQIIIGGDETDTQSRVYVKDNGRGIDPDYHDRIFGLFQRLENEGEGTGVGLAVVSRIMETHGGTVRVESTPGEGATFWLEFPRNALPASEER